jgi:hypothetical protein
MYCYEGTNITGEKGVNPHRTQLNDALIGSWPVSGSRLQARGSSVSYRDPI